MVYNKRHVKIKELICVCLILSCCTPIKMTLSLSSLQQQCFYEVLANSQKYSIETIPKNEPTYELEIQHIDGDLITPVHYKMATAGYERMSVHKLANWAGTYGFCIKNIQRQYLNIIVTFQTGVELLEFELLPDKSDAENLNREIAWLEKQKNGLYDTISKIQQSHTSNMSNSRLLSTKMIIFAILGLVSVVGVNYLFYTEVKKTFRDRKLI